MVIVPIPLLEWENNDICRKEVVIMGMVKESLAREPTGEIEREVGEVVGQWAGDSEKLIMAMLAVQDKLNWLPPEALDSISRRLEVPKAQIYHIATFYKVFSLSPRGKHILQLCTGTACHVRGAPLVGESLRRDHSIPMEGTSEDGLFTLETVHCIGACAIGPVLVVDGKHHGEMTQNRAGAIVKRIRRREAKEVEHA